MALPASWSLIPITGTYRGTNDAVIAGDIIFETEQFVVIDDVIVVPRKISVKLDAEGKIPAGFSLPSTDDPDLNIRGWAYNVTESFTGGRKYKIFVPHNADVIDLGNISPVVPPALLSSTQGQAATITVGNTLTGAPGSAATVVNVGTDSDAVFNFVIPRGADGEDGTGTGGGGDGIAATIEVGTTTTGATGVPASVTNSGTSSAAVFDFVLPRGDVGDDGSAATIAIGTVTTGEAGSAAQVTNAGTPSAAVFDFVIPQGADGDDGDDGIAASIAVGSVTTGAAGTAVQIVNSGSPTAAVLDFTIPRGDPGTGGGGGIQSIVPGANITVNNTDPLNPVVSATGGAGSSMMVDIRSFIQGAEGSNITAALGRAIAAGHKHIGIPNTQTWTLTSRLVAVEHLHLEGFGFGTSTATAASRINCNGGLVWNNNATLSASARKRVFLTNIHAVGNGTANTYAVDGPMGGRIEGCIFDGFTQGIRNPSAFLFRVVRCGFYDMDIGLNIVDANETTIEDCFFDASCTRAVDMLNLTTFPGSGSAGFPIIIRGNNINVSNSDGILNKVSLNIRAGIAKIVDNYWEDYSPNAVSGNEFLNLTSARFDDGAFEVSGNEANGQGHAGVGIRIMSNHSLGSSGLGVVTRNRLLGFSGNAVVFGSKTDAANTNNVSQVQVYHNNDGDGDFAPVGANIVSAFRPMYHSRRITDITVTASTWTTIPTTVLNVNVGGMASGNAARVRKVGVHSYKVTVTMRSTGAAHASAEVQLIRAGVQIDTLVQPVAAGGKTQFVLSGKANVASLSPVTDFVVQARNGGIVEKMDFEVEWYGNGWQ